MQEDEKKKFIWDLIAIAITVIWETQIQVTLERVFPDGEEKQGLIKTESHEAGTSLVAQWLRVCLPMQGTWVRALVQEDPTCHGATKPVHHNY